MTPTRFHFSPMYFVRSFLKVCLILIYCVSVDSFNVRRARAVAALFQDPEVFLTISPIASYKQDENNQTILLDREIVLNWRRLKITLGSYVGLFNKDPVSIPSKDLKSSALHVVVASSTSPTGDATSTTRYIRQNLTWNSDKCLGYWIAHFNDKVLQSNCLQIYPTWMHDLMESIKDRPLHSIMMAGSHNAGAWRHFEGNSSDNVFEKYLLCQEDSVYQQLIHGIRYLDIRVGYYPETNEKFWINHDQFRVRPLNGILTDVKRFVYETKEIVLLDFHRFPTGFNTTVHKILIKMLENEMQPFLAPKTLTKNATLADFWKINRTLIIGYDETNSDGNTFLWPNVEQAWANTNKIDTLEKFLKGSNQRYGCKGDWWAAMGQLTFTIEDIFFGPEFGIRGFANMSNTRVSEWYQRKEWYSQSMVVATDYYLGNNLIEISYQVNKHSVSCM